MNINEITCDGNKYGKMLTNALTAHLAKTLTA